MCRPDKEKYYLAIAETVAQRSTCLHRRYGAIIVKNNEVISTGYNGAPRGEKNCCDCGYCHREAMGVPKGERYELCVAVHAPQNAIISAARKDMIGATIYIVGLETDGSYANPAPCLMCRRFIRNAGIVRCVGNVKGVPTEIPLDISKDAANIPASKVQDTKQTVLEGLHLDGGYITVAAYADMAHSNKEDVPTEILGIEENFLKSYAVRNGWKSLDEFLETYTYDQIGNLRKEAKNANALAFSYCDDSGGTFHFPDNNPKAGMLAYIDFLTRWFHNHGYENEAQAKIVACADYISGWLYNEGYKDASRALDFKFRISNS